MGGTVGDWCRSRIESVSHCSFGPKLTSCGAGSISSARVPPSRSTISDHRLCPVPLVDGQVPLERFDAGDATPGFVGDEFRPPTGLVERCLHHPEVDGIEVGDDHETVTPVIDLVLDVVSSRADALGGRRGVSGWNQPALRRLFAARVDHDPLGAPCRSDVDEESLVVVGKDLDVVALWCAETVPHHSIRPLLFVSLDVEAGDFRRWTRRHRPRSCRTAGRRDRGRERCRGFAVCSARRHSCLPTKRRGDGPG